MCVTLQTSRSLITAGGPRRLKCRWGFYLSEGEYKGYGSDYLPRALKLQLFSKAAPPRTHLTDIVYSEKPFNCFSGTMRIVGQDSKSTRWSPFKYCRNGTLAPALFLRETSTSDGTPSVKKRSMIGSPACSRRPCSDLAHPISKAPFPFEYQPGTSFSPSCGYIT